MELEINRKKPSTITALIIISVLSVTAAYGLTYFRPVLFTLFNAVPATFTYFGLFGLLVSYGRPNVRKTIEIEPGKHPWLESLLGEVGIFLFLTLLSAIIGAVSGIAWWSAGGSELRTLFEAIWLGALIGAITVVVFFTGL